MSTDRPRFSISVSNAMLKDIVDYQSDQKIATKSGAIQRLIRMGIEELKASQKILPLELSLSEEALRIGQAFDRAGDREKELVRLSLADQLSSPKKNKAM